MKYTLVLLAAMIATVCGAPLGAELQGVTDGDSCSDAVIEELYETCVVDVAVALDLDVTHTRRLELRGNRELQNLCRGCYGTYNYPHWCAVMGCGGGRRRHLTIDDEHVHPERFLYTKGEIEQAANNCLRKEITEEGLTCLGNPEELTINIFLPIPPIPPIDLGYACNYVILAKTGISTVPNSVVTGDIGVSPIAATAMTGFSLASDSSGQFSTSSQVTGKAYAADYSGSTPADMTAAVSAMEAAYTNAAARPTTDSSGNNMGGGAIGGNTLTAGVYTFTVGVGIASDLTFTGGADDVFVIQTTGDLTQAANTQVLLTGEAQAKNIFWQVAGFVEIGAGASMQGNLLVKTKVDFITGSSLVGSVQAQTAVNLQMATITQAAGSCN
jgi:hypothetical protein